jgi:hypothetical protein
MKPTWPIEGNARPTERSPSTSVSMRRRATLQALILAVLAGVLGWKFNQSTPALILTTIAGVNLICGWFLPAVFHAIDKFVQAVARWIGIAMTWILLVPFYYLFFGMARLCLAIGGKDPMCRSWNKNQTSYWVERPPVSDPAYYTRQY